MPRYNNVYSSSDEETYYKHSRSHRRSAHDQIQRIETEFQGKESMKLHHSRIQRNRGTAGLIQGQGTICTAKNHYRSRTRSPSTPRGVRYGNKRDMPYTQ